MNLECDARVYSFTKLPGAMDLRMLLLQSAPMDINYRTQCCISNNDHCKQVP